MQELETIEKILAEGRIDEAIRLLDEYITSAPEPSDRAYTCWGMPTGREATGNWR